LVRYLLPTPPIPGRLRRRSIAVGASAPSRAICSTLIAEAFHFIHYPILPNIEVIEDEKMLEPMHKHIVHEILHIRDSALFVPRDFDISPYFAILKPTVVHGFDYRKLVWK
jgi:hypothetical protein